MTPGWRETPGRAPGAGADRIARLIKPRARSNSTRLTPGPRGRWAPVPLLLAALAVAYLGAHPSGRAPLGGPSLSRADLPPDRGSLSQPADPADPAPDLATLNDSDSKDDPRDLHSAPACDLPSRLPPGCPVGRSRSRLPVRSPEATLHLRC